MAILKERISYTVELFRLAEKIHITKPADVTPDVIDMMFKDIMYSHEEMHAMYLDNAANLCFTEKIGQGTTNASLVNEASMFTTMFQQRTLRVILIHNHPSGFLQFSKADKSIAHKISRACLTLECSLLDFLVVTPDYQILSAVNEGIL